MLFKLIVGLIGLLMHFANAEVSKDGKCDIFSGKWIRDSSPPRYTNASCEFMSPPRNCIKNGRPDTGYLFWKWKPYDCDLRPLEPKKFLNSMRNKSFAMIGDSLLLNQMQSLLCLLSQGGKSIDTYHSKGYQLRRWYFSSYNFTLSTYWAPFLLQAYFRSHKMLVLHLDKLDTRWTTDYHRHDYILIALGPWFSKPMIIMENNTIVGCHSCHGKLKELGTVYPYRRALQMAFNFITESNHKPVVFVRTWSPRHFEHGEWFNGGICNRTEPYNKGEYNGPKIEQTYYDINIKEFNEAVDVGYRKGIKIKLVDVFHLSMLRPDGHPGPYMKFHPFDHRDKNAGVQNDCTHWCLPGPIDAWNDLLMEMLINEEDIILKDDSRTIDS
ncbi:uncharacterized protein A4U43_C07F38870 [Asparagus officinalis]|uniref:Uncharacterized protein n=1 Tax=Asparagus officinalis TaxID=4686 RepID=A0A5P1EI85_ASPOF|nr:protein trichome birefringence-like 26 [Asparagus officinalis]ONK65612.1 uncharacterized protein A4U43_C07F38870 [Asparagus officinalis]